MTTPSRVRAQLRAFTLVEVLVSAALMGFVLLGVLTTFLFMGRSGANLGNYTDMEASARRALEQFAEDARQASAITWATSSDDQYELNGVKTPKKVTFTINTVSGSYLVDYSYDPTLNTSALKRPVYREVRGSGKKEILLRQVDSFQFTAYQIINPSMDPDYPTQQRTHIPIDLTRLSTDATSATNANKLTKQVQISLRMSRTDRTVAAATNSVLSARYILRNKLITN